MSTLAKIQFKLNAPKGQYNSFGKYKYRSAEDILEAVKPLLHEFDSTVNLSDDVVMVGEHLFVKATATFECGEEVKSSIGWAMHPLQKKGMDESQITGTASSYARKYALNGLFAIDDAKDADTDEHKNELDNRNNGNQQGQTGDNRNNQNTSTSPQETPPKTPTPPVDKTATMLQHFANYGVTKDMIEDFYKTDINNLNETEIAQLRGASKFLKQGDNFITAMDKVTAQA